MRLAASYTLAFLLTTVHRLRGRPAFSDSEGVPVKITIIGAGSVGFTRRFAIDILSEPAFEGCTICLMDNDPTRLGLAETYVKRLIEVNQAKATCVATTDRVEALRGAFAAVVTIRVAASKTLQANFAIPARYGMRQTVADTIGPSGVFYGVHNGQVLLDLCREMETVAPDGVVLNYTNPMAIVTALCLRGSATRFIGLCHSVQEGISFISNVLEVDVKEMDYCSAGVNHCAWYLWLRHRGKDMYPALHERSKDPEVFKRQTVRFDLMHNFGYFPTESSMHHAEYHPHYLRHDSEIERLAIQRVNAGVETFKVERRDLRIPEFQKVIDNPDSYKLRQSHEYCASIMRGLVTDEPVRIYASTMNDGLVDNLPPECAVEVLMFVDRNGFHPVPVGSLPPGPAARTAALAHHQAMAAEAILNKDLELLRQSIMVDPNTSATLSLPQIRKMTDEMIEANQEYLTEYH